MRFFKVILILLFVFLVLLGFDYLPILFEKKFSNSPIHQSLIHNKMELNDGVDIFNENSISNLYYLRSERDTVFGHPLSLELFSKSSKVPNLFSLFYGDDYLIDIYKFKMTSPERKLALTHHINRPSLIIGPYWTHEGFVNLSFMDRQEAEQVDSLLINFPVKTKVTTLSENDSSYCVFFEQINKLSIYGERGQAYLVNMEVLQGIFRSYPCNIGLYIKKLRNYNIIALIYPSRRTSEPLTENIVKNLFDINER